MLQQHHAAYFHPTTPATMVGQRKERGFYAASAVAESIGPDGEVHGAARSAGPPVSWGQAWFQQITLTLPVYSCSEDVGGSSTEEI